MSAKKNFVTKIRDGAKRIKKDLTSDEMIEIHSNTLALISGCRKISEYTDEHLTLIFKNFTLSITGRDLVPESLINGQMSLRGEIVEVRYIDNKTAD